MSSYKSSPLNISTCVVTQGRSEVICMDAGEKYTGMIDAILMMDNVPHTAYHIQDGKLFVFEKLVHLVHAKLLQNPEITLDSAVDAVLDLAFDTSPREAVEEWGVIPEPYYADKTHSASGWKIVYRTKDKRFPDVPAWHKKHMDNVFTDCLTDYVLQSTDVLNCKPVFVGKQIKTIQNVSQVMHNARKWNTRVSMSRIMYSTRKWNTKVEYFNAG